MSNKITAFENVKETTHGYRDSSFDAVAVYEDGSKQHVTYTKSDYEYEVAMLELRSQLTKDQMELVTKVADSRRHSGYEEATEDLTYLTSEDAA